MKDTLLIIIFLGASYILSAQQTPYTSLFTESKAFWNPAATAYEDNIVINTLLRKQWISFKGTPSTGYIDYQYPFVNHNMSVGGVVNFDKIGPFTKISLQANYAYKLRGLFGSDDSQLSLGISGGVQSYNYNASDEVYNDDGDPLLENIGGLAPTLGLGFFYTSNYEKWNGNSFYTGLAFNQVLESSIINKLANQKRRRHIAAVVGAKVYYYDSYIEPMLSINYVNPEIIDMIFGAKYELRDAFWAGLGYSTNKNLALQGGIILDRVNGKFSRLKIGALFNIDVSQKLKEFGPGFELLVSYEFDMR